MDKWLVGFAIVLFLLAIFALCVDEAHARPGRGLTDRSLAHHHPPAPKPKPAAHKHPPVLKGWDLYRQLCRDERQRQVRLGLRAWNIDTALYVIRVESGGYARATNGSYRGLFQIDIAFTHGRPWDLYCPATNIHVAADLYGRSGWAPWPWM